MGKHPNTMDLGATSRSKREPPTGHRRNRHLLRGNAVVVCVGNEETAYADWEEDPWRCMIHGQVGDSPRKDGLVTRLGKEQGQER